MSTELKPVEINDGRILYMTQYHGGIGRGKMLQLTPSWSNAWIPLTKDDALALADALHEWVDGKREEAKDD